MIGAPIGAVLGGVISAVAGEDWRGVAAGIAAGALTGATCGLSLVGQIGAGAVVGAAHGAFGAATHGGDWGVGALRGGLGGAAGGALGAVLGGATNVFGRELAGFSGFAKRAGLNFGGDVGVDLGVQGVLIGAGLQEELDLRGALFSGIAGTAARGAHFGVGAIRAARANGWRLSPLSFVLGVDLPVFGHGRAPGRMKDSGLGKARSTDHLAPESGGPQVDGDLGGRVDVGDGLAGVASLLPGSEPVGGVYLLVDPATGVVMRTGRSKNLRQRQRNHSVDPRLFDLDFVVAHRTDAYAEQRGLEHLLYVSHPAPLNKIAAISRFNPRRSQYLSAARRFLESRGEFSEIQQRALNQ